MTDRGIPSSLDTGADQSANDATRADRLVCPQCGVGLGEGCDQLHCPECQKTWPIVNGIPHFVENFQYWGEIPLEHMREVNRRAETGPWKAALLDSSEPSVQRAAQMILNLERANWQWLVDLPADSRVLDVGAGMGTNSHALATHYREVVALEPVLERVQFMQQRFCQERLSNIEILRSSVWTLPFRRESFDLVAMNGVLEWVAEGQTSDPREIQESALRKLFALLRPGGYLYLGIENRLSLGYFVGYPDPHCGLPFVTVLPRPLAHWYARRKGQNGYRNYLYSAAGYSKLLRKVGFTGLDIYLALPSYNHSRFLIPLGGNIYSYYSQNFNSVHGSRLREILHSTLRKLNILKHCEYSFVILVRK